MELNDYSLGDCPQLEKSLSIYDPIYFSYIPKGFVYEKENRKLLIPAGFPAQKVAFLTDRIIETVDEADEAAPMSIRLITKPRSDLQKDAISFLVGEGQFANNKIYTQLVMNLNTGEGKTYVGIVFAALKRLKTAIIINTSKIKTQWYESLLKYTDIDKRSILEVKGSRMCLDIIDKPHRYKQIDVFIITHSLIHSFCKQYGWNCLRDLFKAMKVGIKIYDEAHLEFRNMVKIDCYTNTKYSIYLTATFGRSAISEDYVYQKCFLSCPKYIQKKINNVGKKYINYIVSFYKTNPTILDIDKVRNKFGFDRNKYSKYQLDQDEFYSILKKMVEVFTKIKKNKTILLMTTIEGIREVSDFLKEKIPDIFIAEYHSKIDPEMKDTALKADLIISTMKSLGVGADIPGLQCVINTESYKSNIIVEQVVGRLRKIDDETKCNYVEIVDTAFNTLKAQQKSREKVLTKTIQIGKVIHIKA